MIATRRFRYGGKWIAAGATLEMSPKDERAHRLVGLVTDPPEPEAPPAPKRRRKKK